MTVTSRGQIQPLFLIVPGLNDSGPTHWQSQWLRLLKNAKKADLGEWSSPRRDHWVQQLDAAIRQAPEPVILIAHSLGCHAFANWAKNSGNISETHVCGALLVAPPDCDHLDSNPLLREFGPTESLNLPFPVIVAGSRDDDYASISYTRHLAKQWHGDFVDMGELGHINAASGIGHWPAGLAMLGRLISRAGLGKNRDPNFAHPRVESHQERLKVAA